jgi:hypothetical protein
MNDIPMSDAHSYLFQAKTSAHYTLGARPVATE